MKSAARKPPRRMSRALVWFVAFVLLYVVVVPSIFVLRARASLTSAVARASAIRLEEYFGKRIFTSRDLAPAEFAGVAAAVPFTLDYGAPGLDLPLCWSPHHRIIVTDSATARVAVFEVCFKCNMTAFSTRIMNSPRAWHQPLRLLFTSHGVPVQEEYVVKYMLGEKFPSQ